MEPSGLLCSVRLKVEFGVWIRQLFCVQSAKRYVFGVCIHQVFSIKYAIRYAFGIEGSTGPLFVDLFS